MARECGSAVFSSCRKYRYLLTRVQTGGRGSCLFIMLNPSVADACTDDPTVRRCSGFAGRWGYCQLEVVNLFGFMATRPEQLRDANDPVGPDNDTHIIHALERADLVVAAWGNHGTLQGRSRFVMQVLHATGRTVFNLGVNGSGEPVHPLYVPYGTPLLPISLKSLVLR